jgi:hypothetical protein
VADTPEAFALLRESLQGAFSLQHAATLDDAKRLLGADTPLLVCGCHFDEGRMYDLLRHLKAQPGLAAVPFLALRALEGKLEDALYESVKIATHALGGNGFVDLFRWKLRYGEVEARHRLTRCVEELARGGSGPTTF